MVENCPRKKSSCAAAYTGIASSRSCEVREACLGCLGGDGGARVGLRVLRCTGLEDGDRRDQRERHGTRQGPLHAPPDHVAPASTSDNRSQRSRALHRSRRNVSDKSVAAARHRDDKTVVVGMLAEHASEHVDRLREVAFVDDDVGPEGAVQGLLFDERAGAFDQVDECAEDFRCQRDRPSIDSATQHAAPGVELESFELVNDVR